MRGVAHGWTKSVWRERNLQVEVPLEQRLGELLDGLRIAEIELAVCFEPGLRSNMSSKVGTDLIGNW